MEQITGHAYNPYLPWVGTAIAVGYAVYLTLKSRSDAQNGGKSCVNQCVRKDADKVVDSLDVEDLPNKAVFCRCWKSEKFPYCDGTHNQHNQTTGDNVGPLIIQKKA